MSRDSRHARWSCDWCAFFFSSRRRHTRLQGDWSSDVCSSDSTCVGLGYGLYGGAISWDNFPARTNPIRPNKLRHPSHTTRPTNINVVPIDYPLRARLRGRLTLLRLALSRNPWNFGERASHPLNRYSCLHSHFRYLHGRLPSRFNGLRNAPLPLSPKD